VIPVVDKEKCNGCEACKEACPPQAIRIEDEKAVIVEALCEECGVCADACPAEAIVVPRK
jgi:Fe-S-cluster-containing hydrogenase component 2